MSYMDTSVHDETQTRQARNKKGSGKLLARLIYHHGTDANMQLPEGWKPKPKRIKFTPPVVPSQEFKDLWFGLVEDADLEKPPLKIIDIKRVVCQHFKITHVQLISQRRHAEVTRPRQIVAYFAHKMTGRSLPEIGRMLGNRDHTTIIMACRRIASLRMSDWIVAYDVALIEEKLDEINSAPRSVASDTATGADPQGGSFARPAGVGAEAVHAPSRT